MSAGVSSDSGTSDWVNLCIKLFWALAFAISSIQLIHLEVLDGASKDAQNPSFSPPFFFFFCQLEFRHLRENENE